MGRRNYGTGSLNQVGTRWVASWYGPDGRRIKRAVGPVRTPGTTDGLTRTQAEKAFRQLRDAEAMTIAARRVTMEDVGEQLRRSLELKGRKKSHRETVASELRRHIVPFFGSADIARLGPADIERYIAAKQRTLSIKTVRNHVNLIHACFQLAMRKGWCSTNPVKLADRPVIRTTETRIRFLEQHELNTLVAQEYPHDAWGSIEPTLYLTAAMTGLRQGELIGMRWRDVDFKARKVRVVSPFVRGEFGDPKSEGSGRSVPMADRVAEALLELRLRTPFGLDDDLVFAHPESGGPLDRSKLIRRFKEAVARAGVRPVTFHELRHTFGTRMAAHGVPLRRIQQWMGHADAKTTQVYAHYQPDAQENETVNAAFA